MKHPIQFVMAGAAAFLLTGVGLFVVGMVDDKASLKTAGCWLVLSGFGVAAIPLVSVVFFDLLAKLKRKK